MSNQPTRGRGGNPGSHCRWSIAGAAVPSGTLFVLECQGQYEALAMPVETLSEACSQGWRVTVRCANGRTESPRSQSSRECSYRKELDMETLVWTRGRTFPLSRLERRLRCPRCGSRYVVVLYEPPRG